VFVQIGDGQCLSTVGTLRTLVVVNLSDVTREVGHGELLVAMGTWLLDPLMSFSNMTREVVNRDIFPTIWTIGFFSQMNTLHVVIKKFFGLKFLLTVGTLVVSDLFVEILDMVVKILVFFVANMTGGGLG